MFFWNRFFFRLKPDRGGGGDSGRGVSIRTENHHANDDSRASKVSITLPTVLQGELFAQIVQAFSNFDIYRDRKQTSEKTSIILGILPSLHTQKSGQTTE